MNEPGRTMFLMLVIILSFAFVKACESTLPDQAMGQDYYQGQKPAKDPYKDKYGYHNPNLDIYGNPTWQTERYKATVFTSCISSCQRRASYLDAMGLAQCMSNCGR